MSRISSEHVGKQRSRGDNGSRKAMWRGRGKICNLLTEGRSLRVGMLLCSQMRLWHMHERSSRSPFVPSWPFASISSYAFTLSFPSTVLLAPVPFLSPLSVPFCRSFTDWIQTCHPLRRELLTTHPGIVRRPVSIHPSRFETLPSST